MNNVLQANSLPLAKGGVFTLSDATETQIRCEKGVLWLTQDNDVRDIVLEAGQQFEPDRDGTVLVFALADSALRLETVPDARPVSFWQAMAARFRNSGVASRLVPTFEGRYAAVD